MGARFVCRSECVSTLTDEYAGLGSVVRSPTLLQGYGRAGNIRIGSASLVAVGAQIGRTAVEGAAAFESHRRRRTERKIPHRVWGVTSEAANRRGIGGAAAGTGSDISIESFIGMAS